MNADLDPSWRQRMWQLLPMAVVLAAVVSLAREPRAAGLALDTLAVVAGSVLIALPCGVVLAALLTRTDLPGRGAFIAAWCVLLFLPLYLQASAWDAGFGQQGWFTLWTSEPGKAPVVWLKGLRAAIWIHALAAMPWMMLIVGAGLRQVEAELEEQALLDLPAWRVFAGVTFRRALPEILAAVLLVSVFIAGEMTVTDIYRVRTYAEELYTNAAVTEDAVDLGLSIWPQIAMVAAFTVVAAQAILWLAPTSDRAAPRRWWVYELGTGRWPAFWLVVVATGLALGVPLANLVYKAGLFMQVSEGTAVLAWSATRFSESVFPGTWNPFDWRFASEYGATVRIGLWVATVSAGLGLVLAWGARRGGLPALPALLATTFGLAMPGPLVALGVIWLLNRPAPEILPWIYDKTVFAPVLAISVRTLPIATMILWGAVRSVDQEQLDAAQADGGNSAIVLWQVVLPQRWPAVAIAWLVSFAWAAGDLSSSILVIPPGQTTIANQIFLLIHAGVHNAEAGLCLGQLVLFSGIAAAVMGLWQLYAPNHKN